MMVAAIFATYPMQMFPVISMLEGYFFATTPEIEKNTLGFTWKRNLLRALIVIPTVVLAIAIPQFSLFISLVGAVGCSLMGFILPCIFHIKIFMFRKPLPLIILHLLLAVFGVVASIISASVTIVQIYEVVV